MSTQPELSSEDFKARLYQSLKGKGILDSVKSQLRNKLATELHVLMGMPPGGSPPAKSTSGGKCLRSQVANSIVAQYLQSVGYEYSLSTFLPEAGLHSGELISEADMICFLRISPYSEFYVELQAELQEHRNLLESLLEVFIQSGVGEKATSVEASVQVLAEEMDEDKMDEDKLCMKSSMNTKLRELEEKYAKKAEEENGRYRASLEDRLNTVQKDLEAHYKKQLQTEMELFRMREMTKMRQEEKERYRGELTREREELQQAYQSKLDNVKRSEKISAEASRRKEKELEASIFSQRQLLLDEMNSLRVKEAGLKRQAELDKMAIELERERIKGMSEQMERSLQQMNAQFDMIARTKTKQETAIPDVGPSSQETSTQKSLMEKSLNEDKIKRLQEELHEEKRTMDGLQDRLMEELSRVDSLKSQLRDMRLKNVSLQKAKEEAELKLAQCADYHQLKVQVGHLKQVCSNSETTIAELEECTRKQEKTIQQLTSELSQAMPNEAALREELVQMREAHHRRVLVLEYDKKQVCKQLQRQAEQTARLQRRLDQQLLQLKSAQREMEDLQGLLDQKASLSNTEETGTRHRERKGDTSVKSSKRTPRPAKSALRHQPQKSTRQVESFAASSPDISGIREFATPTPPTNKSVNFFDSHLPFLAESKAAIRRIEKEAEELERSYQEFQHRRTASPIAHHSMKYDHSRSRRLPSEELPSLSKEQFSSGRATPMDYLRNDPVIFTDPPHHSTAHYLMFSSEDLRARDRPSSRNLTLSSRASEHGRTSSHRQEAPSSFTVQQQPTSFTVPTCNSPPLETCDTPPNLSATSATTATATIAFTTTSAPVATAVTLIPALPVTSPVASPTRTDTVSTPATSPPPLNQGTLPVDAETSSLPLRGPENDLPISETTPMIASFAATTTITNITSTVIPSSTKLVTTPTVAAGGPTDTQGATAAAGPSVSLQSWWKSSEPTPATSTELTTAATSAPMARMAHVERSITSVPTSATPISTTLTVLTSANTRPQMSLDSFWNTSQQQEVATIKTDEVPHVNEVTSHTSRCSSIHEESQSDSERVSATVTEVFLDHSEQLASSHGGQETGKEKEEAKEEKEEELDPVMLKYMKLVEEKRKSAVMRDNKSPEEAERSDDILSQQSSIGGDLPSEPDDPFEDW